MFTSPPANKCYKEKVPEYGKSNCYLTRSLFKKEDVGQNTSISRINTKLLSFDKWESDDIEKRQLLLIEMSKEIWKTTEIIS